MSDQTDPRGIDEQRAEEFAERLVDMHQSLTGRAASEGAALPDESNEDDELRQQLDSTHEVLKLIERVRRREASDAASSAIHAGSAGQQSTSDAAPDASRLGETREPPLGQSTRVANQAFLNALHAAGDCLGDMPRTIGRFQVLRKLGEGGYGIVLLVFDPRLKREVALKLPRPATLMTSELRVRFLREAEAAAALNHANVVPVFEVGNVGPICYIASAYCEGPTLEAWLKSRSEPLEPRQAARIVNTLAEAVQHAHSRGVLHRDLKPANVLLDTGRRGLTSVDEVIKAVRITDFGLAKIEGGDPTYTRTGSVLGTPSYMSPEQSDGGTSPLGHATDIHALGAMLYELLTGRPPFQEATLLATLQAVRTTEPRPPRRLRSDIPRALEAICLKCLEKRPERRFESATALEQDLQRYLDGEPVRARRITPIERGARWCRRNPLVSALAAAVVALALGSTVTAIQLAQSRRATVEHLQNEIDARLLATENEFDARVAQAHAVRRSQSPGQRQDSLDALRRSMVLAQRVPIDEAKRLELRNEAIASMSLVDLEIDKQWPLHVPSDTFLATDADCQRYAHADQKDSQVPLDKREARASESGAHVLVRSLQSNQVLARLPIAGAWSRFIGFRFSPDGAYLGARYEESPGRERFQFWRIDTAETVAAIDGGGFGNAADFGPEGRYVALVSAKRNFVEIRQLPSFELSQSIPFPATPVTLACHPSQPYLACQVGSVLEICDLESGRIVASLPFDSYAYKIAWSPEGRRIAVACRDGSVRLYPIDLESSGTKVSEAKRLEGHTSMVINVAWHPDGGLLASSGMDGATRLWDATTGERLLTAEGPMTSFSRNGAWLGTTAGRWRVIPCPEHRTVSQPEARLTTTVNFGYTRRNGVTSEIDYWEAYPGGRLLIGQNFFGAMFLDAHQARTLAEVPLDGCWMRFSPDGSALYTVSDRKGISRLPVRIKETEREIAISIGPPEHLLSVPPGPFALCQGNTMILSPFLGMGQLIDRQSLNVIASLKPAHPMLFWSDITPDGRFAATGTFKGQDVQIRDARDGRLLKKLPADTATVWFSPDSRLLAVAEYGRFTFWKTESWELAQEISSVPGGVWPNTLAFSGDGRLVAIEDGPQIRLLQTRDFSPLANFHVPPSQLIESVRLTPSGDYLVAGGGDQGSTHVWDLRRIRSRLREMDLDWPSREDPASRLHPTKPLRLELRLGEIAQHTGRSAITLQRLMGWVPPDNSLADLEQLEQRARQNLSKEYYQAAIRDFTRIIDDSDDPERAAQARHSRGVCYARRALPRDAQRARADQLAALAHLSQPANCHNSLAWLQACGDNQIRDPAAALQHAQAAADSDPQRWAFVKTLGVALYRLEKYPEAMEALERAHRCRARQVPSHHLIFLAMAYFQQGDRDRATQCYQAALEWWQLLKDDLPGFRHEEFRQFRQEAESVLGDAVPPRAPIRLKVTESLRNAVRKSLAAIEAAPHDFRGWRQLSMALINCRMYQSAILEAGVMIEIAERLNHGYYWRGLAYYLTERYEESARDFEKSLELRPEDANAMRNLAYIYSAGPPALRKAERALALAENAARTRPEQPAFAAVLGIALFRRQRYQDADLQLRRAQSLAPNQALPLYFSAMCQTRLNDDRQALRDYLKAERSLADASLAPSLDAVRREARRLVIGE